MNKEIIDEQKEQEYASAQGQIIKAGKVYNEAEKDVASFVQTGANDTSARGQIIKAMRGRAKDEEYASALKQITPDLSKLMLNRSTAKMREEIYALAIAERELTEVFDKSKKLEQSKAKEQTAKTNESEQGQQYFTNELVALKNQYAGKDVRLVMAKDNNGVAYTGTIIAETGDKVLQRVSEKYVVVHEKSKLARDVEVGSTKRLAYENGQINVLEPSQDRKRSQEQEADRAGLRTPEQARKESFFQAREIVTSQYGAESKIWDAKDSGDYKGAIVAITKNHVAQQLGANSFVVHDRDKLTGDYHKGNQVQIKYTNGQAVSTLMQKQREQGRERAINR